MFFAYAVLAARGSLFVRNNGTDQANISDREGFFLITAPTAANANLRAQRGVFVLHRPKGPIDLRPAFYCTPVEQKKELAGSPARLLRFTLAITEAPKLGRLLARDGVCGAALFPTYEGAAKTAQEAYWWDYSPNEWEDNSDENLPSLAE